MNGTKIPFSPKEDRYRSKYFGILNRHGNIDKILDDAKQLQPLIDDLKEFVSEATERTESVYFARKNIENFEKILSHLLRGKHSRYIDNINEIYQRIQQIKSAECIMDYDTKTEQINNLKRMMDALATTESMKMSAGIPVSSPQ